jgi:lipoyl-dependent peroxiredoxin subunit D
MSLENIKTLLGDYAKDIKLNLSVVLTEEGAPELNIGQIYGIALASAYATKNHTLITAILADATMLDSATKIATQAAATIMAMNNVYYRFIHLVSDQEYSKMQAKLRMNVIGSPGISKIDFELFSLAISAINGCGMCMEAHAHEVTKAGINKLGVQSCIRIASVINAAAQALDCNSN